MPTLTTCRAEPARAQSMIARAVHAVAPDGTFEGYASLFDREDMGRDVVAPGAFADSLKRRGPRGVKMLFQHDANQPIGVWDTIREDARGLYVTGRLIPDIAKARDVHAMLRAGALDGLSIGFRALSGKRDRSGVRRLTRIDLWEISIVTFPMLPDARVSAVKARPRTRASPPLRAPPRDADETGLLAARIRALTRDLNTLTARRSRPL